MRGLFRGNSWIAVCMITDFFGTKIAEVKSPVAGKVLYIVATPPIVEGQPVGCVGVPAKL